VAAFADGSIVDLTADTRFHSMDADHDGGWAFLTRPGMHDYYAGRLSGDRLRRCYAIASPRVQRYLEAEIRFVLGRLEPDDLVLELGCGYGRVTVRLTEVARHAVGIDTAPDSLALARRAAGFRSRCDFLAMDALALAFGAATFDTVVCVQNGICAFGVDKKRLVDEALRVTRPGGRVLFSSYAERFWPHRRQWFEAQAAAGLMGAIDDRRTGAGVIVCEDGFRSGTMTPGEFHSLAADLGVEPEIHDVDESSIFCVLAAPQAT